jgi:WD40 repeat protein
MSLIKEWNCLDQSKADSSSGIECYTLSSDDKIVATITHDHLIKIWDFKTLEIT